MPKPLECNSCHTLLKTNKIGEIYSEMPSYKQENCIRTICQTILSNFKLYAGDKNATENVFSV